MITFSNEHLTDLPKLRQNKLVKETLISGSIYHGKTMKEIIDIDPLFMSYIGSFLNSEWSWPLLQYYKQRMDSYVLKNNVSSEKELGLTIRSRVKEPKKKQSEKQSKLYLNSIIKFGKHNGKTLSYIRDKQPKYYTWLKQQDWVEIIPKRFSPKKNK